MNNPKITVIIAVYNNFKWLRLILDALRMQTFTDFEIAIADDGSDAATVEEIRRYAAALPDIKIIHAWHPDRGWRKNIALNNALRASSGEYLVFVDGDCIPHPRFLDDHWRLRRKGFVVGGRRVESGKPLSDLVESWESLPSNFFSLARRKVWSGIFSQPLSLTMSQLRRMWRFPFIGGRPLGCKSQGILGANFGIHRSDIEKINGFDERYLDPGTGEDCDLDVRLENAGIHHLKFSHYALMIHRCHPRLFWGAERNKQLLREAQEQHLTYIPTGLHRPDADQHSTTSPES